MQSSGSRWFSLVNEPVHTVDDLELGRVYGISKFFLVVKKGIINLHFYYIPLNGIEGWDGNVLWLNISEEQAKSNYERERTPDILKYHMKEHPNFSYPLIPLPLIPMKGLKYEREMTQPFVEVRSVHDCPLCKQIFKNGEDLEKHMQVVPH